MTKITINDGIFIKKYNPVVYVRSALFRNDLDGLCDSLLAIIFLSSRKMIANIPQLPNIYGAYGFFHYFTLSILQTNYPTYLHFSVLPCSHTPGPCYRLLTGTKRSSRTQDGQKAPDEPTTGHEGAVTGGEHRPKHDIQEERT